MTHPLLEPISVRVQLDVTVAVYLDVDEWVVVLDGREASVTHLTVRLVDGHIWLTTPKGVYRRPNGVWAAAERNLIGALPRLDGRKAWAQVPDHVKDAVQAAYAAQIAQLPATLPIP